MRMAKSGHVGTPMKDFADLIMPHLTSMEGAINASHTTDQTTMDSYGAAFTTCTEAKTTADGEASTLLVTKGTQSTAHKNCRTSEGMAQTNYTNCVTAMNSLETSKKTACDAYILANKAPDVNLVPQPGMGASYRSWLVSVKDWVINELANLDAAHESCVNASILYDNKKLECEGANGQGGLWLVHDSLKTQCNANQTALEGTTCSYASAVESACSGYSTCYTNANTSYFAGKANLLSAQSNRILEYQLVKRLMCFCNLFSAANGADLASADIDTCKNTNHSTLHLQLTLPTVPAAPQACLAVVQRPCTTSYTSTEYGSLPSNAPAAACNICPWATTTTTTTTQAAPVGLLLDAVVGDKYGVAAIGSLFNNGWWPNYNAATMTATWQFTDSNGMTKGTITGATAEWNWGSASIHDGFCGVHWQGVAASVTVVLYNPGKTHDTWAWSDDGLNWYADPGSKIHPGQYSSFDSMECESFSHFGQLPGSTGNGGTLVAPATARYFGTGSGTNQRCKSITVDFAR